MLLIFIVITLIISLLILNIHLLIHDCAHFGSYKSISAIVFIVDLLECIFHVLELLFYYLLILYIHLVIYLRMIIHEYSRFGRYTFIAAFVFIVDWLECIFHVLELCFYYLLIFNIHFKFLRLHIISFLLTSFIISLFYNGLYNKDADAFTGIDCFGQELQNLIYFAIQLLSGLSLFMLIAIKYPKRRSILFVFCMGIWLSHILLLLRYGAFY